MLYMKWLIFSLLLLTTGFQSKTTVKDDVPTYYSDGEYHDTDLQVSPGKNLLGDETPLISYGQKRGFFLERFNRLHDMAILTDTTNLFLIEQETDHIIKLDSNGRPLWTFRSHGRGPGEFTWPSSMKIRNDSLYIFDIQQRKISLYNLDGEFIQDIIPQPVASYKDFEITPEGNIIIPNLYPQNYKGALFLIFNDEGEKIGQFGKNSIVQDDMKASGNIPAAELDLSTEGRLILSFNMTGALYVYDFPGRKLLHSIKVRKGPEWEVAVERTKKSRGYPQWINDVCITSTGDVLIAFGGPFKDNITVGMRFSAEGEFLGRIFGNEQLQNVPSQMVLENDSTLWVQDPARNQFFRTHLRPFHKKKE